jgi:hypothetical protein
MPSSCGSIQAGTIGWRVAYVSAEGLRRFKSRPSWVANISPGEPLNRRLSGRSGSLLLRGDDAVGGVPPVCSLGRTRAECGLLPRLLRVVDGC